jgi:hypothetical protein
LNLTFSEAVDWATTETETATNSVVTAAWIFVAYSVSINPDAITSTVRFWINNGSSEDSNIASSKVYLDFATSGGYEAFIGTHRTTDITTFAGIFSGFIYSVYIYNSAVTSGAGAYGTDPCTDCLNKSYIEYALDTCDNTSC